MQESQLLQMPQSVLNAIIIKQLAEINRKLEKKVAYIKVEDAVDDFIKNHLSKVKTNTKKNYLIMLQRFKKEFEGRNIADNADITPDDIAIFLEKYWGNNHNNTKVGYFILLKAFFNKIKQYQVRKGMPDFLNPCDALKGEYAKSETKQIEFTDDTILMMKRLIGSASNERMKATFIVLCTSGMRANEICSIRREQINGQIITLWDHKGIRYNCPDPKPAIAVIPKLAAEIIEKMNTDRPFLSYRSLWDALKVRQKQGIIPKDTIIHDFRKYVYTFFLRNNEPFMAQFIIRHKSDKSVSADPMNKIYLAPLSPNQAIEKMKMLESCLGLLR